MAELKPIEVIMRIDFAASNGKEVVAHAERVQELVRCENCKHWSRMLNSIDYGYCELAETLRQPPKKARDFCSHGRRKETENES